MWLKLGEQEEIKVRKSGLRRGLTAVLGHLFYFCPWGLAGPEGGLGSVAAVDSAFGMGQKPGQDGGEIFRFMKKRCFYMPDWDRLWSLCFSVP